MRNKVIKLKKGEEREISGRFVLVFYGMKKGVPDLRLIPLESTVTAATPIDKPLEALDTEAGSTPFAG